MQVSTAKIMTTREIAELTSKEHRNVMRDVKSMLSQLEIKDEGYAQTWVHPQNGQEYFEYALPKDLTLCLVAGYSAKLRLKIIERWQELESQAPALPQSFSEALQLAADQAKQLEEQAPKIEVYDRLAARKEDVSTTTLAKQLSVSAIKLNKWLRVEGFKWLNKDYPKAGYESWFNVVADVKNGHEFTQCLITPKGQIEIAKRFEK